MDVYLLVLVKKETALLAFTFVWSNGMSFPRRPCATMQLWLMLIMQEEPKGERVRSIANLLSGNARPLVRDEGSYLEIYGSIYSVVATASSLENNML